MSALYPFRGLTKADIVCFFLPFFLHEGFYKEKVLMVLTINDTTMVRSFLPAGESGQHDIWPRLTGGAPEHSQITHCSISSEDNLNRTKRLWKMCLKLLCLSMAVEGSIAKLPNIWRFSLVDYWSASLSFDCLLASQLWRRWRRGYPWGGTHRVVPVRRNVSISYHPYHVRTSPWKTGQRCRGEFWHWHFSEAVWSGEPPEIVWENQSWPVGSRRWCFPPLWWSQRCSKTRGNSSERGSLKFCIASTY